MSASQNQLVTIAGKPLQKIEFNGQAVVTLAMIDEVHNRPSGTARRNYNANTKHLVKGLDFILITSMDEFRTAGIKYNPSGITLLTESGYLKLVKTFTDDLAWQVQGQLVECYFHVKQAATLPAVPTDPIMAMLQAVQTMRQEQITLSTQQQVITTGLTETRKEVADLKANMKLENWQQANLHKAVNHKISIWLELYPSLNIRKAYPAIWRHLKEVFSVPRYNEIPAVEYDRAINTVTKLNMSGLAGL